MEDFELEDKNPSERWEIYENRAHKSVAGQSVDFHLLSAAISAEISSKWYKKTSLVLGWLLTLLCIYTYRHCS